MGGQTQYCMKHQKFSPIQVLDVKTQKWYLACELICISYNYFMLAKWSQKEDQDLARLIKRYGTTNWALIRKHFKSNRSRDSVIKRWHGKLKLQKGNQNGPSALPEDNNKAPPIIRKTRDSGPNVRSRSEARAIIVNIEKGAKIILQRPNNSKRFQRLRNLLQGTKESRSRGNKNKATKNVSQKEENQIQEREESQELEYEHEWNKIEDQKLRSLVINEGVTSWAKLGEQMGCSEGEVKKRWKHEIYDIIKLQDKVGGFLKYSTDEDAILTIGHRNGLKWEEIMVFLPGRSEFSIEARWRRLARSELEVQLSKNKHFMMRQLLKRIVEKRKTEREPLEVVNQLQIIKQ